MAMMVQIVKYSTDSFTRLKEFWNVNEAARAWKRFLSQLNILGCK